MHLFTCLSAVVVLAVAVYGAPFRSGGSIADMVNDARLRAGVSPLRELDVLRDDAWEHSKYQANLGQVTHQDSRGQGSDRLSREGVQLSYWAENVAYTNEGDAAVFDIWMNSPQHRDNILSSQSNCVGISQVDGYWTQVFARV
ncbi:hypothetical protein H4R34_001622 [Dimargaris verticillata]|uniref:SCP domain-containing protein n=1 Tax=Dimargaris verticillata TaxID=2761393 RepID=A0A9W8EEB4_9FUNG|nr:hypothetical protein H4R34_001622 [Dimargaris verticillata]